MLNKNNSSHNTVKGDLPLFISTAEAAITPRLSEINVSLPRRAQ